MMTSADNTYKDYLTTELVPNTLVSVRLSPVILAEAKKAAKRRGYTNVQELIRETLRKEIAADIAKTFYGSGIPTGYSETKAERDARARAFMKEQIRK